MTGQHTPTHCHCGKRREMSDHCEECGCEEYERVCDHVHKSSGMTPQELAALPLDQLQNVVLNGVCTMLEDAGAYLDGRDNGQHGITQFASIGERKIIITVDIE